MNVAPVFRPRRLWQSAVRRRLKPQTRGDAEQLAPLPKETVVACIGPRTAFDTRAAGLPVHVIAEERSTESLIEALIEYAEAG